MFTPASRAAIMKLCSISGVRSGHSPLSAASILCRPFNSAVLSGRINRVRPAPRDYKCAVGLTIVYAKPPGLVENKCRPKPPETHRLVLYRHGIRVHGLFAGNTP